MHSPRAAEPRNLRPVFATIQGPLPSTMPSIVISRSRNLRISFSFALRMGTRLLTFPCVPPLCPFCSRSSGSVATYTTASTELLPGKTFPWTDVYEDVEDRAGRDVSHDGNIRSGHVRRLAVCDDHQVQGDDVVLDARTLLARCPSPSLPLHDLCSRCACAMALKAMPLASFRAGVAH